MIRWHWLQTDGPSSRRWVVLRRSVADRGGGLALALGKLTEIRPSWPGRGRARGQAHPVSVRDRQADDRCTLFLHGSRLVYLPMTRQTHRDDGDGGALPPRVAGRSRLGARARTVIHLPCRAKNPPSVGRHCSTVARQPERMPAAEYKSCNSPPSRIAGFFMSAFRRFSLAVFIRRNT